MRFDVAFCADRCVKQVRVKAKEEMYVSLRLSRKLDYAQKKAKASKPQWD